MRNVAVCFIVLATCVSCIASPRGGKKGNVFLAQKDAGYGKMISDSVASIMFNARNITCELQSKNPSDTLRQDTVTVVPPRMHPVVHFLFFNESNFRSDDTVYGKFEPWVCYQFKAKRRKAVYLELDFGLRKWRLLDADKKQIGTADMKENSVQFLYLTRLLFPEDVTLKMLDDNLNTTRK